VFSVGSLPKYYKRLQDNRVQLSERFFIEICQTDVVQKEFSM
jgi:hypothetical protein